MFLYGMRSPRSRPSSARPICDTRQLSLAGLGKGRGAQDARLHQTLPDALRGLSPLSLGAVSRPAQCVACRSALTRTIGSASVYLVDSVGEQTAVSGKDRGRIDRRYVVSGRRCYDRRAMQAREWVRFDDKAASRLAPQGVDGGLDLYVAAHERSDWLDLE